MGYGQRLATVLGLLLAFAILCSGSGFLGYFHGYRVARTFGYSEGYDQGRETGYEAGYEAGYRAAQDEYKLASRPADGKGAIVLRKPTYQEVKEFLAEDATNLRTYEDEDYVCVDFAAEVNNNAEEKGIRCAVVDIFHPGGYGHTVIAFDTVDRGLVFIEPQFDLEVKLEPGKSYSRINGFTPAPRDDTIVRYVISW